MWINRRAVLLGVVAVVTLVACGPSAALKEARSARYQGTRDEVYLATIEAVKTLYPVFRSDPEAGTILTDGRWYEPDGPYADIANANRDTSGSVENLSVDGAVFLGFIVQVVGAAPPYAVAVLPSAHQVRAGYAAPYKFKPDDPQLPGWVIGKREKLEVALHARLKGQFITPPGATAPAP